MSGESVIVNRPKLNVILIALFLSIDLCGQDVSKLLIFESIDDHQQTLERYARTFKVTDSLSAFKEVLHVISNMQRDGYLTASLDSIKNIDESYGAHIFVGKRYKWGQLKMSGVPADWRKSAFNRKWNQSINGSDYSRPFAKLLEHANNNGYPFARVQLDSLLVVENSVFGTLQFKPGPLIRFDTLDINGTESRKKYLSSYLKIHPGSLYNERKANKIPEYFENLPITTYSGRFNYFFIMKMRDLGLKLNE